MKAALGMRVILTQDVARSIIDRRIREYPDRHGKVVIAQLNLAAVGDLQMRRAAIELGRGRTAVRWPGNREVDRMGRGMKSIAGNVPAIGNKRPASNEPIPTQQLA